MTKVFLSYAAEDNGVARTLAALLRRQGFDVYWFEQTDTRPFAQALADELGAADRFVVLFSRHYQRSKWRMTEWTAAFRLSTGSTPNRPVITVCEVGDFDEPVPVFLGNYARHDLRTPTEAKLLALLSTFGVEPAPSRTDKGRGGPRRVFLSHSHDDRDRFVLALAKSLDDNDVEVWLDRDDMPLGHDIAEVVFEQINSVDAFVVVVSDHTRDSNWVRMEVNMAVRRAHRDGSFPVICARLDGVATPPALSGVSSIKISASLDHTAHLDKILQAIRRTS
ncbi:toll/interleukin-1 receptor domain-containing protein [Lentzea kentuckyensis]|uniref:toll/interleukin-1 receptor domain-containing protein n=1 Tax=Lentzea kentuckyensis TaxID=360086 RepID=UPI001302AD23|nr:toll/interleukin-1 receptor domain-containing protein [Lentzea kentuckyensis]